MAEVKVDDDEDEEEVGGLAELVLHSVVTVAAAAAAAVAASSSTALVVFAVDVDVEDAVDAKMRGCDWPSCPRGSALYMTKGTFFLAAEWTDSGREKKGGRADDEDEDEDEGAVTPEWEGECAILAA